MNASKQFIFDSNIISKVSLASDKISNLNKPCMLLKLDIDDLNLGPQEKILELTPETLRMLLEALKKAQEVRFARV